MEFLIPACLYIMSFVAIWLGSGVVIISIDSFARKLRFSSFALSFLVLGLLTSIPETAVGINAIMDNKPEIFVGTLLGGTVVIFLFVIPLLAMLGKGVKLNHDLDKKNLLGLLAVIAAPSLVVVDHDITVFEGAVLVLLYIIIFYSIKTQDNAFESKGNPPEILKSRSLFYGSTIVIGIGVVYFSSQFIVSQTLIYAQMFHISAFYISLLVLSIGTNIPELSLAIRAILSGKKDIAFGDYLGSAAANTLLMGIFTLMNRGEVFAFNSFLATCLFIVFGLGLFYFFSQTKKDISRKEGALLFIVYIVFVLYEINKGFHV